MSTLCYPKESKLSRVEATRALRAACDAASDPYRKELDERLEALLTREQHAADLANRAEKPLWIQVLEDVQREQKAASQPVTSQAAASS